MKRFKFLRLKRGMIVASLSVGVAVVGGSMIPGLSAQDAQPAPGLRGIIAEVAPFGLLEDDFLVLGDSWAEWSKATSAEVAKLYESESSDAATQRESIATLRRKIGTMEKALGDSSYRPIFNQLATLHSRLSRRVDLYEAILDTFEVNPDTERQAQISAAGQSVADSVGALKTYLSGIQNSGPWLSYVSADELSGLANGGSVELSVATKAQSNLASAGSLSEAQQSFLNRPAFDHLKSSLDAYVAAAQLEPVAVDQTALRATLTELVAAIEAYEETRSSEFTNQIRTLYRTVRTQAGDGGQRIADALTSHYFNYNLRVVASESFINKVVSYEHKDTGRVDDFILGAKVDGTQWTTGRVSIDLKPSDDTALFNMAFNGTTQTSTQGVTDQATIFTSGYHTFSATKAIRFDGDRFTTSPAAIHVYPNNTTQGARTAVSGLPIVGGIADSYAVGEARKRKGESEAIAAYKLKNRLLPEFNQEVDAEFSRQSDELEKKLLTKLREAGLFPSARSNSTSETEMWISNRLMDDSQLGGDSSTFSVTSEKGVATHLHQTWLNNALAKLPLAGKSLTEKELIDEISKSIGTLLGRDLNLAADKKDEEPDNTKFVFPEADVLRVRIENGQLILILRTGLQPDGGEAIPTQEISIPLLFSIDGTDIVIEAGDVSVAPVEPANQLVQIPRAGIVRSRIQKALPRRTIDRMIDLDREKGGPVKLEVSRILPNSGWLSIVIE
jgi:hypothetical protein